MEKKIYKDFSEALLDVILKELMENYWGKMYEYLNANPELIKTVTGFLIAPQKIIFYFGRSHMAIEYLGPERIDEIPGPIDLEVQLFDFTQNEGNFFEQIIGFEYDSTHDLGMPLPEFVEDLLLPTNSASDELVDLGWNFYAQDAILAFNSPAPVIPEGQFTRVINGLFFDADESGLKTRHIKWLDIVPVQYIDDNEVETDQYSINLSMFRKMVKQDCHYIYPLPPDFKYEKLQKVNRFIEVIGNRKSSETKITGFLSQDEFQFILSMHFGARAVLAELNCEWQSRNRKPIRPDFFIVKPNGYADIVEFKLPNIKGNTIVGTENRETLSAAINSYISQTRSYRDYFDDPNNRKWVEEKYGFKVYKPRRYLVIGRRWDFSGLRWKEIISDYQDLDIITYDDLIDGVVAQFYI